MLHRAARNAYSWWWASHIRTKQSKWLEENIKDMQEKVEYILKIIEEDGDSFAQRAEMYYRKRPELVNFVEDSFRGYRALAERYDHLSKELQSANRTIATVYPEQVQLAMEDDYDENSPTKFSFLTSDPDKPKNLPAAPKLTIPDIIKAMQPKKSKAPTRLMSKKGLIKIGVPEVGESRSSGMTKAEALKAIDKLQKEILGFQTEKEFVKSAYESSHAKYWEIEEKVTEMQSKVSSLQDEFGIGTFIEDEVARNLMASAALKSCQEALVRLQEKKEHADEEARVEYQRVRQVHKKLKALKQDSSNNHLDSLVNESMNTDLKDLDQEIDNVEQEKHELEMFRAKIKEQLSMNSSSPLTMSELAEKIDDLVEKVIALETAMSSQNALVKRIRSETGDLEAHVRSLEEDKEVLVEGSDTKSSKIRDLEQELNRIQTINENVKNQNRNLQIHFTEASFNLDHLSEKLQTVKQDEEVDPYVAFKEVMNGMRENPKKVRAHGEASQEFVSKNSHAKKTDVKEKIDFLEQSFQLHHSPKSQGRSNGAKKGKWFEGNDIVDVGKRGVDMNHTNARTGEEEKPATSERVGIADHITSITTMDTGFMQSYPSNDGETGTVSFENGLSHDSTGKEKAMQDGFADQHAHVRRKNPSFDQSMSSSNFVVRNEGESKGIEDRLDSFNPRKIKAREFSPINHIDDLVGMTQDVPRRSFQEEEHVITTGRDAEKDIFACSVTSNQNEWAQFEEHEAASDPANFPLIIEDANANVDDNKVERDEKSEEVETDADDDQPNWKLLFLDGLDDRQKVLLQQYTAILRNYKEAKKKVSELEKLNNDTLFNFTTQLKELRNANATKDAQIQSLHKKLNLLQICLVEAPENTPPEEAYSRLLHAPCPNCGKREVLPSPDEEKTVISLHEHRALPPIDENHPSPSPRKEDDDQEEGMKRVISMDESLASSPIEEKFRSDIDGLLEENIEFWLRFSSSFHQIHKFQTSVQDLLEELADIRESSNSNSNKQEGSTKHASLHSSLRPIYKHLREIQTELAMWFEHNSILEEDLQNRISALSSIQEEILRLSNAENHDGDTELSNYQAAKFQGEVMNMKQENNKVAYKLQEGLDQVKHFQADIVKTLSVLEEELGISSGKNRKNHSRSRIPLRSFLFGVRLRKQKPSNLFQCMSPALQKQYSDLNTVTS